MHPKRNFSEDPMVRLKKPMSRSKSNPLNHGPKTLSYLRISCNISEYIVPRSFPDLPNFVGNKNRKLQFVFSKTLNSYEFLLSKTIISGWLIPFHSHRSFGLKLTQHLLCKAFPKKEKASFTKPSFFQVLLLLVSGSVPRKKKDPHVDTGFRPSGGLALCRLVLFFQDALRISHGCEHSEVEQTTSKDNSCETLRGGL